MPYPTYKDSTGTTRSVKTVSSSAAGSNADPDISLVVVDSSALPTGAATSAKQDTGNTSIASIDTKTPALGQALAAACVPVVLTAAQISALTPPAAISGFATESTLSSLNGKVTACDTGSVTIASSALPTGAATETTLSALNTKVNQGHGTAANAIRVELPTDGTGLVNVAQSGTWNITNVSGTISLPTGAATESTLSSLNGKVTACDTGAVVISSSALPTGAATSAKQDTGNTSVASIDTKTPALGQALAAASVPVVLTAAQLITLTPPAAITGFATETTLSALNTKVTACNTGAVTISSSALPTGAATAAKQPALGTAGTASSDVITVQGIASGTPLISNITQVAGSTIAQGHGTAATAIRVELPTDGTGLVNVAQSGTWTIQPGNTANTTAWKVDGSAVTQPVSIATAPVLVAGSAIIGKVGIDQTTPGTTDSVSVKTTGYVSQPTVTRPANTTAYTAGDVVGGAITFTSVGPSGGHIVIDSCDLRIDVAAIPSGMTTFRLYLYDVTPPSALADNAAWDLPSGDRASFLGYIDIGTVLDLGSTLFVENDTIQKKIKLNASTSVFGYLVTAGAFTPAGNSEVYVPRLQAIGV